MSLKIKRSILCWLSLLLFHFAHAQGSSTPSVPPAGTPPAGPATDSLLAALAAAPAPPPDSVAALHRLFVARRANRALLLGATAVAGTVGALTYTGNTLGDARAKVSLLLLTLALEAVLTKSYTSRDENQAVQALREHRLADNLKRKLKPQFFQPAEPGLPGTIPAAAPIARVQDSLSAARSVAQVAAPPAGGAPDTVAALHRLFADKRSMRTKVVLATLGVDALLAGITVASGGNGAYSGIVALAYVVLVIPIVVPELLFYGQYTRRQERLATQDFQVHRRLKPDLKRKLTARYFQP